MPSNKDLSNNAHELAKKLNITVITSGLNNAGLVKLLAELKLKLKDAENDTIADDAESTDETTDEGTTDDAGEGEDDEDEDEDVQAFPYSVAAGKSITSKRGILGEGEEVKVDYLPGGKETLDSLVDRDFVVKG